MWAYCNRGAESTARWTGELNATVSGIDVIRGPTGFKAVVYLSVLAYPRNKREKTEELFAISPEGIVEQIRPYVPQGISIPELPSEMSKELTSAV